MNQDIQFQIECISAELVKMLMDEYGWDVRRAFDELYKSQTFEKLNDPLCGLYYQGSVYVFQFLKTEMDTGSVA